MGCVLATQVIFVEIAERKKKGIEGGGRKCCCCYCSCSERRGGGWKIHIAARKKDDTTQRSEKENFFFFFINADTLLIPGNIWFDILYDASFYYYTLQYKYACSVQYSVTLTCPPNPSSLSSLPLLSQKRVSLGWMDMRTSTGRAVRVRRDQIDVQYLHIPYRT